MNFQELIRRNRFALIDAGYSYKTLWAWWSGLRYPKYESIPNLWKALVDAGEDIQMRELPYYKVERKK